VIAACGDSGGTVYRVSIRLAAGIARACPFLLPTSVLMLTTLAACRAADLDVIVVERSGRGVTDVVVIADFLGPHGAPPLPAAAVMDQRNRAFVPRVLVVAVGAKVEFPNNDTVSHQVYSFSDAKKFQLPLYKGERHSPVIFDKAGLVVLGCNIHDDMAGYIYVTASPYYGKTDADGVLHLQGVPAGNYRLTVWSPFIADPASGLTRDVLVDSQGKGVQRIQLTRELRAQPEPRPRRGDWEY
jgi:plastocyanin